MLAGKLLHPVQVGIAEAFSCIGLPLCVRDLAEIIDDVEAVNLDYHVGRLRNLGALQVARFPQTGKGFMDIYYELNSRQKGLSVKDDRNPLAVHLGGRIRAHRVRLGISQEELVLRTSLHRTEVGMIERGQREPRLGTIVKLATALEVPLGSLLTGIEWKVAAKSFAFEDRDDEQGK